MKIQLPEKLKVFDARIISLCEIMAGFTALLKFSKYIDGIEKQTEIMALITNLNTDIEKMNEDINTSIEKLRDVTGRILEIQMDEFQSRIKSKAEKGS